VAADTDNWTDPAVKLNAAAHAAKAAEEKAAAKKTAEEADAASE
jgi:hypothetical protein